MDIYSRIKLIRKDKKLTQAQFGALLGVSRDVYANLENNRLAKPETKEPLIRLICKEFNVNEDWLRNGIEPMYMPPESFSLDKFAESHDATDLEISIVKAYFELDPDTRRTLVQHFKEKLSAPSGAGDTPEEVIYKNKTSCSVQCTGSSASNTTGDIGNGRKVSNI